MQYVSTIDLSSLHDGTPAGVLDDLGLPPFGEKMLPSRLHMFLHLFIILVFCVALEVIDEGRPTAGQRLPLPGPTSARAAAPVGPPPRAVAESQPSSSSNPVPTAAPDGAAAPVGLPPRPVAGDYLNPHWTVNVNGKKMVMLFVFRVSSYFLLCNRLQPLTNQTRPTLEDRYLW